jgi:uncharacterized protein (TIGR03086 family)
VSTDRNPHADRYRRAAEGFSARVDVVPADAWERPAPCEGWVARDVVRHLVEWVPAFFASASGPDLAASASVDDDPVAAWHQVDAKLQAALDDQAVASRVVSHPHAGTHRFDEAIATFVLADVLVHTWDLARATGLDERLDPELVHEIAPGMLGVPAEVADAMRSSGQYGAPVELAGDADEQARLIAFTGRRP